MSFLIAGKEAHTLTPKEGTLWRGPGWGMLRWEPHPGVSFKFECVDPFNTPYLKWFWVMGPGGVG